MAQEKFDVGNIGAKLKALREQRRLSMRELASLADLSVSFISKIESGKSSPTVMSLDKILDAMDVDLYEFFFNKPSGNPADQVHFPQEQMALSRDPEHVWFHAFPKHHDIKMKLTYEEVHPKTRLRERELHKGDICGFIIEGELTMELPGDGVHRIVAGDAFYVRAGRPHVASNESDKVLKIVSVLMTT